MQFGEWFDLDAVTFCLRLLHLWQATKTRGRLFERRGLASVYSGLRSIMNSYLKEYYS